MTRVIVTGCRNWNCFDLAMKSLKRMKARYGSDLVIVHGAASGVDATFGEACAIAGVTCEEHPADWNGKGRAAGPLRNSEMVARGAEFCLAVHRNLAGSKGTGDCVRKCLAAGIPVYLIDREDGEPVRYLGRVSGS